MTIFDAASPHLPEAACAQHPDPEIFFPVANGRPGRYVTAEARAICATCPERLKCLQWAVENNEHGIWAGTTEEQRARKQKKPLTQEQRRRMVRRHHKAGLTDGAIANELCASRSIIQNDRRALGLIDNVLVAQRAALTERRALVRRLYAEGWNDVEIARRTDSNRDAVRRDRLALGLEPNHQPTKGRTA